MTAPIPPPTIQPTTAQTAMRVVRSVSAAIGSSSVATIRADSSSFSNLPRTSSIASASISDPCLLKVSGKTTISMLPAGTLPR